MANTKPNIPAKSHPWRRDLTKSEVNRWNKEQSDQTRVHNFRVGQLKNRGSK